MTTLKRIRLKNSERPVIHKYAEVWLNEAIELLRPTFRAVGCEIPSIHVSVGFSTCGYNPKAKKRCLAVCHARCLTRDGINEIYISPLFYEPVEVISVLVHELIHAIDDCGSGHGKEFQRLSRALKCIDNLRVPMHEWRETLEKYRAMALQLGRYPRGGVVYSL